MIVLQKLMLLKEIKHWKNDKFVTSTLTLNEAEEKLASLDITTNLEDTNLNLYSVNYAQEKNARENRLIAYSNMEKLLPFYNKETIISYGNKLPDHHKLNTEYFVGCCSDER